MDVELANEQALRNEQAEAIIADAHRRAAAIPYTGVRVNLIRAAEHKAQQVRAGLVGLRRASQPTSPRQKCPAGPPRPAFRPIKQRLDEPPRPTQRRSCLLCCRAFDSDGPGNRLCDPCGKRAADASPYAV